MKVFDTVDNIWSEKVNFVDKNNVFLGYDTGQICCEHADWFVADEVAKSLLKTKYIENIEDYVFDTSFFETVTHVEDGDMDSSWNALDEGAMVVFKITSKHGDKYIHLFNCHNGYYGHGFEFKIGDEVKIAHGL